MFEYVQNNRRAVQFFLALIMLPFAFFGLESYIQNSGSNDEVASIGSSKVSLPEFQQALRDQQERFRQQFGRELPAGMLDTPEVRRAVLESLINQRVLALHMAKSHLIVDDALLSESIQAAAPFQEDGKFSRKLYEAYVSSQNKSPAEFERLLRQDLSLQRILGPVRQGAISSQAAAEHWIAALQESRDVSEIQLRPEQFAAQINLGADATKTYYEANKKSLELPEQLRAEYLVLSQDALAAQVSVADAEISSWYQAHERQYRQTEERQASHILVTVAKDAPEAAVNAAQQKAQDILSKLRKAPGEFSKLAKQHSQDPGSAEKGGNLGWFGRGMMVKPFEDSVFSLKVNETSDVVRSDFGFHIIRLTGIKAEQVKPLAQVRGEIVAELRRQAAAKKYAELAEGFSNTVYEQADSLKPAADKFKLTIQQSAWLTREGAANGSNGPLGNPKLIAALFSDDAIKSKRNTEAVEVAPNTLVAARILEHKPATLPTLDVVKADIEKRLIREESAKLAKKEGEAQLARLSKGEAVDLKWSGTKSLSRIESQGFSSDGVRAVFAVDASRLPAYAGVIQPDGGYALYRISQVKPYVAAAGEKGADAPQIKSIRERYARMVADEEMAAWLAALRQQYKIEINKTALESKDKLL